MFNNINNTISGLAGSVGPLPSLTGGYSGQLMSPNPNNGTISAAETYPAPAQTGPVDTNPYDNMTMVPVAPTAPATPRPTGPVLSSTGPRQEFNSYQAKLDTLLNQPDPFAPMYEQLKALNQTTQDNAIASATTASARQKFQEEQSGQQYQAGLATAGQQTGTSRYLPEYQLGLMESARNSTNDRIMQIDQAEKMAIAKAQQARIEGDVAVLKEQLNQVNELRKEKIRSLERAQDLEWDMKKFQQQMALDREKFSYQKSKDATDAKTAKKTQEQLSGFYTTARTILNTKGKDLSKADFEVIINEGLSYGEKREDILLQLASNLPDIKKKKLKNTYGITDVEYEKYFSK